MRGVSSCASIRTSGNPQDNIRARRPSPHAYSLRGVALGRKSWLFAGSERGGQRAAFMYSLIGTAKLNNIDPQAWLADAIARISDIPVSRLPELLPWNWKPKGKAEVKAA